jgi:uncharacterized protein
MPRFRQLLTLALAVALLVAPGARSASSDMVVSQLFAGGGNANAPYANDFAELFNRSGTTVDLSNWSIQYASASGTIWLVTPLSGSVQPGGHYLVQLASAAAVGAPLPTPDATGTSNLAVSRAKVALARGSTPLGCGASAGSCSADPLVADLIGYGSATDYEGSGPRRQSATRLRPCAQATVAPISTRTRACGSQKLVCHRRGVSAADGVRRSSASRQGVRSGVAYSASAA